MSSIGDSSNRNTWRSSNSHRQQPSRSGSGASTPSQQQPQPQQQTGSRQSVNYSQVTAAATGPVAAPPPATNVWADRSRSASAARTPAQAPTQPQQATASPVPNGAAVAPVSGKPALPNTFNSAEIKDMFKRVHTKSTGSDASKAIYRAAAKAAPAKPAGAWSKQPSQSTMANGQDFFRDLAKQVAALEKGEQGRGG